MSSSAHAPRRRPIRRRIIDCVSCHPPATHHGLAPWSSRLAGWRRRFGVIGRRRHRNLLLTSSFRASLSVPLRILRDFGATYGGRSIQNQHERTERPARFARRPRIVGQAPPRGGAVRARGARPPDLHHRHPPGLRLRAAAAVRAEPALRLAGDPAAGRHRRLPVEPVERRRQGRDLDQRGAGDPRHHHHQVPPVPGRAAQDRSTSAPGGCASSCSTCSSGSPGCSS